MSDAVLAIRRTSFSFQPSNATMITNSGDGEENTDTLGKKKYLPRDTDCRMTDSECKTAKEYVAYASYGGLLVVV